MRDPVSIGMQAAAKLDEHPAARNPAMSRVMVTGEEVASQTVQMKTSCALHFLCVTIGVVFAIVNNEVDWMFAHGGGADLPLGTGLSAALKGLVLGSTLVGFLFLYKFYESKLTIRRLSGVRLAQGVTHASLSGAGLLSTFVWDVLFMLPVPLPGLDWTLTVWNKGLGRATDYTSDSVLCIVCMLLRVSFLPRFYGECMSELGTNAAQAFARFNRIKLDETFTIKFVLANSLDCVMFLSVLSVFLFSYCMMVSERPVGDATLSHFSNCVWLIVITMTTVGYGDEYPTTFMGRLISIMASIAAVVMLAIIVNLVITKVSLSRTESKVIEIMDRVSVRKKLKLSACIAIQRWARAHQSFMRGEAAHQFNSAQGYMVIPEMHSAARKNQDLQAQVWSDLPLLEALNEFRAAKRDNDIAHMRADLGELTGALHCQVSCNNKAILALKADAEATHNAVLRLYKASAAARAQTTRTGQ